MADWLDATKEDRIRFAAAVANILGSDKEQRFSEHEYLAGIVRFLQLSIEDDEVVRLRIESELKNPQPIADLLPKVKSPELRKSLFRVLAAAAFVDQELNEAERQQLEAAGVSLGFDLAAVRDFVAWSEDGVAWEAKGKEILGRL
mgnify:CR=1 FL=1